MPIIKSAKKKMRSDKRKRARNLRAKLIVKAAVKTARQNPGSETFKAAQRALDKAVTTRLIHRNKAARLKSRLVKGATKAQS